MRSKLRIAGLLLLLILIGYGRSLWQGFAPLDDDLLITRNLAIRGMTAGNLKTVFTTFDPELYIPLTFVSYQINYLLGGLAPFGYHLVNILLHALNAFLVVMILERLIKGRDMSRPYTPYAAVIAGMIFAVHPLNTEAVVWLAARKDLLSTCFFLASFLFYLRWRDHSRPMNYAWSLGFFVLALLSKVMAVTLPIILILTDLLIERRHWNWKILIEKIPYFILSGMFFFIATLGKERILARHDTLETALMAAKSTGYYLLKFLLPFNLGVFYPYRGEISLLLPDFFLPVLFLLALAALIIWSLRWTKTIFFGAAFFLITLAPTFTNFHKGGEIYFASDRYPYLPSLGLLFVVCIALEQLIKRERLGINASTIVPAILIGTLTILSSVQTRIWDSAAGLFAHTLELYPESIAARVALASIDRQTGQTEKSLSLLREGARYGDSLQLRMGLGLTYAKLGRVDDAVDQFNQAQAMEPENPEPMYALASLDEHFGRTAAAKEKLEKAVALDPSFVAARNRLASLLIEEEKFDEAEIQLREALKWNPNTEGVLYNLSLILDGRGDRNAARDLLERAHALSPDDAKIAEALAEHR